MSLRCRQPVNTEDNSLSKYEAVTKAGHRVTDFILKAEKQIGVAYRELLANLYQHLLEKCLTGGAANMNRPNYCPVNSSTQVAGQFPSQAYLFVYIISKSPKLVKKYIYKRKIVHITPIFN